MPQIKVTTNKGLVQETTVAAAPVVKRVSGTSSHAKGYVDSLQSDVTLTTGPGVHVIQEEISLTSGTNAKVIGIGSYSIPQGAVLLEASAIVTAAFADDAGNGINVAFGAAGSSVGDAAVVTTEFLGDGGATEIPAGDIAIGNTATAGQTASATNTCIATGVAGSATVYVNDAGDNTSCTGTGKLLLTLKYIGQAPAAL